MKTLLLSLPATLCAAVLFRYTTFDFLDLIGDQFDISWAEILDDLTSSFQ
ncbi:hypothetical protein BN8_02245 [Fibrisoma limi BUZ 3]|uniref:Uncharacterized protein n=1 Tax=Fibrisoma limi BUZ 3 TaxID=1185876 RepID=I2GGZ6_9BACT|nr:hypothetical protein [Fibrisoma limi]CCH53171.1 hypothetical protein BN8_02245 [Fibrisoma limi BUZ 3]